jgi:hypothetical protein
MITEFTEKEQQAMAKLLEVFANQNGEDIIGIFTKYGAYNYLSNDENEYNELLCILCRKINKILENTPIPEIYKRAAKRKNEIAAKQLGWKKEYIFGNGVDGDVWISPDGKAYTELPQLI